MKILFSPDSPYAAAKVYAHNITKIYRKLGIFAWQEFYLTMNHQEERNICNKKFMSLAEINWN